MAFPISDETRFFHHSGAIDLESGETLEDVQVGYRTWGEPRSEATLICHALTGSADADEWWDGLFGPNRTFDPAHDYIIASNVLGGCYGTTGPTSTRPGSDQWYGRDFPRVTIRDMVEVQARLVDHLEVERLRLVIGGSMGGMQALEWAAMYPDRVGGAVAIGDLSGSAGVSSTHLAQRFKELIGVTPKRLARIARFQHALALLDQMETAPSTRTAAACGFADQAHFVRDFRDLAGVPPSEHLLTRAELTGFFRDRLPVSSPRAAPTS